MMALTELSTRPAAGDTPEPATVAAAGGSFHQWNATLRAYRAVVEQQRSFLAELEASGDVAGPIELPPPFVPPAKLGPMPAACLDEALALQRDTRELIATATAMLARRRSVTPARPMAGAAPARSSWSMDQRI